ncbi:hypothetical protein SDC9_06540 [bioreactor metagenome]|uniref:NAD-specific glutamate dehydrogenase n=1 Tax=bioreactor metagenome TaxID=1076179 RepID=A0A644T253_9ZZZZ
MRRPHPREGGAARFRRRQRSIAVVIGLVGAVDGDADVLRLIRAQLGQLDADLRQMQPRHLLVEMLGQDVDAGRIVRALAEQLNLRQHLVGEGSRHHEARVPRRVAEVEQAPFRQQDDPVARGHLDHVHLILDVRPLVVAQRGDLDLVVEMADVADDRHVLHHPHVLDADHVLVAGGGDEDVGLRRLILEHDHLEAVHRRLQRADRIDFGHLHPRARALQRGGAALAHIAIAADDGDLARHHHVGGAADAVNERFLAAVLVVELRLGDRVVHVDRREGQQALLVQVIETMHAGGGFLGHAQDRGALLREPAGGLGHALPDLVEQADLFIRGRHRDQIGLARLDPRAKQDVERGVAAIVEDHVRRALGKAEDLVGIGPVFLEAFALHREDRGAGRGDRGGGVVLGREDVARGPADIGAQHLQRLDQHRGLHRHVQRTGDARALERLRLPELLAAGHQARHFGFGNIELLAAKLGQSDVLDDIIGHERLPNVGIRALSTISGPARQSSPGRAPAPQGRAPFTARRAFASTGRTQRRAA